MREVGGQRSVGLEARGARAQRRVRAWRAASEAERIDMGPGIRPFRETDREGVIRLWERCGLVAPQNDPAGDIDMKMAFQPDLFLVGVAEGRVVSSAMAGYEGHRGWINYLAVDPDHRRRGFGRAMMEEAERRLSALGCVKVNLQVRSGNRQVVGFYDAVGYAEEDRVSMGKRLRGQVRPE